MRKNKTRTWIEQRGTLLPRFFALDCILISKITWFFSTLLGVAFVSLSESLDTSTPAGRMIFTVLGAVAELERSLIAERVRAGLRNARANGKHLGRPRRSLDAAQIAALRAAGLGWKAIARELGCGVGTVLRVAQDASKRAREGSEKVSADATGSRVLSMVT